MLVGLAVGVFFGMFGAGGSAFATPLLSMLGVPAMFAVASPLPAVIPAAVTGARRYLRAGTLDTRVAKLAVIGGVPGALAGALVSAVVGGHKLLVASGVILAVMGVRLLMRDSAKGAAAAAARRDRRGLIVGSTFAVGLLTGLLANGGGFLLVPIFVLVLGLTAVEAAGTSMLVVAVLTVPTLATHWALGHIDWTVAAGFALGLVPAASVGAMLAQRVPPGTARRVFGGVLVAFAGWFLVRQLG